MRTTEQSDLDLLNAWSRGGDREAVGELVRRHIGFVQAVARRCVGGDAHLAEDVTQAVFILLLRKANRIHSEAAMTSWLYTATKYAAANAMKMIRRQRHREMARAVENGDMALEAQGERGMEGAETEGLLHEAMEQLPKGERFCVMMSYMQEKTHGQVAAAMGLSQEAARKRIYRGVERMREFLMSRGMVVPAAVVGAGLVIKGSPASAALIESTTNVAMLAQGPGTASVSALIAKGAGQMLFATKMKAIAAAVAGVVLLGAVGTGAITLLAQGPGDPFVSVPAGNADADNTAVADVKVDLVGISSMTGDDWHGLDGKATAMPKVPKNMVGLSPPPTHQALLRISKAADTDVQVDIAGAGGAGISSGGKESFVVFNTKADGTPVDLVVAAAGGPWTDPLKVPVNLRTIVSTSRQTTSMVVFPVIAHDAGSQVYVTATANNPKTGAKDQWRLVCTDKAGNTLIGKMINGGASGVMEGRIYQFDIAPDQMATLELQTRAYHLVWAAKHIPLATGDAAAEITVAPKSTP